MADKVNIEVMIDTNANSRKMDGQYDDLREKADQQDADHEQTIREFRDYMSKAGQSSQTSYEITQRDTAQIFHEKTNLMTPELADKGGYEVYPRFLRENLEQGHYHVEPPVHGEEAYYDALEGFLREILPKKAPEDLRRLDKVTDDTRGLVLQDMYQDHMIALPKKYRKGQYREAFKEYREVRFNAGEETAINFLRDHPLPPEGERTAFVFVGSDNWANEEMAKARKGKDDEGKMEVFVVSPEKFRKLMEQVIRDVEREQPEMRNVRKSYQSLARIEGDELQQDSASYAMQNEQIAAAPKMEVNVSPKEARAFSSFVNRLQQSPQTQEPQR